MHLLCSDEFLFGLLVVFLSNLHLHGRLLYLQVYNLHRSPYFWDRPNEFEPERFLVPKKSEDIEGWAGFDPDRSAGAMYPNEVRHETFLKDFPLALLPGF